MRTVWTLAGTMLCALTLAMAPRAPAAQTEDWVLLGERAVNDRLDRDMIPVTVARGTFKRIKIMVNRHAVDFHRVLVHFANGRDQEVDLRATIPAGGQSRAVDLRGRERVIRSVEFWYDARTVRGQRAVVLLYGLQ